jgi:peptide/nickel transport system substrate-binding protein
MSKKLKVSASTWPAVVVTVLMIFGSSAWSATAASAEPSGSLTVLEPSSTFGTWNGLDPATDSTANENYDFLNAIFGELFEQGPNGQVVPDLATGYKVVDNGLEVDISLRPGVDFTDGTPFNAAAVVTDLTRDLAPSTACVCAQNFSAVTSVTAAGDHEVVLHLSHPDTAIIDAFFAEAPNWIGSPTALAKMGETAFELDPVGAGPFEVVSDTINSKLSLKANPTYWQKGLPKVSTLTFTDVSSDISGYQALESGAGQAYVDLTTLSVLKQAKETLNAVTVPATATYSVNLNSRTAPFNNILAREAIYYATDPAAIDKAIFSDTGTLSESPTAPGDLFWTPKVPGYRAYDLAKAKALVKQLGGLSFTLSAISSPVYQAFSEAEESEWNQAGIKATIALDTLPELIQKTKTGSLQALVTDVGGYNPALVPGLSFYFGSTGTASMTTDPTLDGLIAAAEAQPNQTEAAAMYRNIFSYLNQKAYAPFLFTDNSFDIADKSVTGISGNIPEVDWQDVAP